MKKYLFSLLAICVVASITTIAKAYNFEVDDIAYNIINGSNNVEVATGGNYSGSVTIPPSVRYNNIDYSVTAIGSRAFYGCTGLMSIDIPNSVTSIDENAFYGCTGLMNIDIPNSVTTIGETAFRECTHLTSVTISNSVTSIGKNAFSYCYDLTNVTIPNSVTTIAESTFSYCYGLKSVTIPNSVITIGQSAFSYCYGLTNVTIPNSVTTIGQNAFSYCRDLTSVTIPNSVITIGKCVFSNCPNLSSVTIPNSVTSIGERAFGDCTNLASIIVESGNTVYDSRDNCNAIIETTSNTLIAGCKNTTIPETVTTIGGGAFYGCSGLTSVTIPYSIKSIDNYAFYHCTGLTSVTWNAKKCKDFNSEIFAPFNNLPIKTFVFGNGVERIQAYLCYGLGLTSVTIPNSVTSIGSSAFEGCCGLTSLIIGNSVTSIDRGAFYNCFELRHIDAYPNPDKVTLGSSVFYSVPKNNTLHVLPQYLDAYKNANQWCEFTNIEGDLLMPDVNSDGAVNVTDMNLVVSEILTQGNNLAYDVNGDGTVNVTDVNLIVSAILMN